MTSPKEDGHGHGHSRNSSSSSSSSDEDHGDHHEKKHKFTDKFRLFGRQKSVHSALGGGKPADIMLWRNKQISASMLTASTVIWLLFERIGYHLLTFVCHALILMLAVLFLWANTSSFFNKAPVDFPEIVVPENITNALAILFVDKCNHAFHTIHNIAMGKDLKKFLKTMLLLWLFSKIGGWFDLLTLVYLTFVMLLTLPLLYEKHEDQVDAYAQQATIKLKKQYSVLDDKVLQKLPNIGGLKQN